MLSTTMMANRDRLNRACFMPGFALIATSIAQLKSLSQEFHGRIPEHSVLLMHKVREAVGIAAIN